MKRHLTALLSAVVTAACFVLPRPFGLHWWSVALAIVSLPAAWVLSVRYHPIRAIEGGEPDA